MRGYLSELGTQWRPLSSATLGMTVGMVMNTYVMSVMAPYLLAHFGWSKSSFAAVGMLSVSAVVLFPFVGRMTDLFGVRRTALVGIVLAPIYYLVLSRMTNFATYAIIFMLQASTLGTTTAVVYCRIIVQYVARARGLALAIGAAGPAVLGAIGAPLLNDYVAQNGWQAGYRAMTIFSIVAGVLVLVLMPGEKHGAEAPTTRRNARRDYATVLRMRAFWIIATAILLCTLPMAVTLNQLGVLLGENGVAAKDVSAIIAAYAVGTICGRLVSGVLLDRFPTPFVATCGLALTAVGLLLLASPLDARPILLAAVLMVGVSHGAESDLVAYLIVRHFGVKVYSTVFGLMSATMTVASASGFALLALMLRINGSFAPYLAIMGLVVLCGSFLFLLLPRDPTPPSFDEVEKTPDLPPPCATGVPTALAG